MNLHKYELCDLCRSPESKGIRLAGNVGLILMEETIHKKFLYGNLLENDNFDRELDGIITLRLILRKYILRMRDQWHWLVIVLKGWLWYYQLLPQSLLFIINDHHSIAFDGI
jgi:hypothetical protein